MSPLIDRQMRFALLTRTYTADTLPALREIKYVFCLQRMRLQSRVSLMSPRFRRPSRGCVRVPVLSCALRLCVRYQVDVSHTRG